MWATQPVIGGSSVPDLDGTLVLSGQPLVDAADDFGHIVSVTPIAVLFPGSVKDIKKMVKFARKHDLRIGGMSMLNNTHSTNGQSQVDAGIVVDMSPLATVHEINASDAWVDAGVRWRGLLAQTLPQGKSPPTLPDFLDLSVGGTLSVGGIGGQVSRHGFVVDNILELEVVTGKGKRVTCSPTHKPELFFSVRAGLGQFAIVTKARVRLIDVPSMVRTYTALYPTVAALTADQKMLALDGRFDYMEGFAFPDGAGGFVFQIEVSAYFAPGNEPDDAVMLAGLSFIPGTDAFADTSYLDFASRLDPVVDILIQTGLWAAPHPWFNMFVPDSQAATGIQAALDVTTEAELNLGPVIIYPFLTCSVTAPFLRVPDEGVSFLFAMLRNAVPDTTVPALLAKNRQLFEDLRDVGGVRYPIGSIPVDQQDWQQHFGPKWPLFSLAKQVFDPDNVLTPGQGIFS